jgi:hypothetical protein
MVGKSGGKRDLVIPWEDTEMKRVERRKLGQNRVLLEIAEDLSAHPP